MQTRHKAPMFDELHNRNLKPPPLARIPIEVCEEIIDLIAFWALTHGGGGVDYGMYYATEWRFALIACAFVCKAWHTRSMYHLHSSVWLTNRDSVEFLFKRLLHDPELHTAIKHIIIRGPAQHGLEPFGGIPHFSTFIARLARQLPNVRTLRLCRAAWTTGSIHAESIKYLSVYTSVTQIRLRDVAFTTASQFRALLSALPNLQYISCTDVSCRQRQLIVPFPSIDSVAHRHVRELVVYNTDDELVDVLTKLSTIAPTVEKLLHHDWLSMTVPNTNRQFQWLLDAYGASLRDVEVISPNESRIDFSCQSLLANLSVKFSYKEYPDFSRVSTILSTITSSVFSQAHFRFNHHKLNDKSDQWAMVFLDHMKHTDALPLIDKILSRPNFASIPRGGIRFELRMSDPRHAHVTALQRDEEYWSHILSERMPRSAARGILDYVLTSD